MPASQQEPRKLIIGIPAYNAHKTLPELVAAILPLGYPIVICDDGSQKPFGDCPVHSHPGVTIIRHNTNQGKAIALRTLFRHALAYQASALLVMDADGQHPAQCVQDFMHAHEKFPRSVIIGNRLHQWRKIPVLRLLGIRVADLLLSLITGEKICDSQCGMRLIPADLLPHLLADSTGGFVAESNAIIIANKNGFTLGQIPIPALYGPRHHSHYRTIRDSLDIGFHLALHLLKSKKV